VRDAAIASIRAMLGAVDEWIFKTSITLWEILPRLLRRSDPTDRARIVRT
jgi:hypothetical protein